MIQSQVTPKSSLSGSMLSAELQVAQKEVMSGALRTRLSGDSKRARSEVAARPRRKDGEAAVGLRDNPSKIEEERVKVFTCLLLLG